MQKNIHTFPGRSSLSQFGVFGRGCIRSGCVCHGHSGQRAGGYQKSFPIRAPNLLSKDSERSKNSHSTQARKHYRPQRHSVRRQSRQVEGKNRHFKMHCEIYQPLESVGYFLECRNGSLIKLTCQQTIFLCIVTGKKETSIEAVFVKFSLIC